MTLTPTQWWLIAAVLLFILEVITPGFVLANVAIGAAGAAAVAALGGDIIVQITAFCAVCLLSFFTVRPLMQRVAFSNQAKVASGVAALVGATAIVREAITMPLGGRVVVNGDDWHAVSDDGRDIEATATVMILRVDSTTLIVRRVE